MSFINSILKAFIGDKSEKDVKALQGNVNKIKALESTLTNLSHDELRAKTAAFKAKIKEARAEKDAKIAALLQEVETIADIDKREEIYLDIDALEKEAYEISEKTLNEILPEAFAVIKETARRFKESTQLTVTATAKDRELSGSKSYITLDGDQAIWANSWNAAGKEISLGHDPLRRSVDWRNGVALG